ncbi:MAG: hypothetical protein FWG85_03400 [Bacteroidetes bacterium]|nr:hypothetical protein [Bacteroidota bacterium]
MNNLAKLKIGVILIAVFFSSISVLYASNDTTEFAMTKDEYIIKVLYEFKELWEPADTLIKMMEANELTEDYKEYLFNYCKTAIRHVFLENFKEEIESIAIHFEVGSSTLTDSSKKVLDDIIPTLNYLMADSNYDKEILILGYRDKYIPQEEDNFISLQKRIFNQIYEDITDDEKNVISRTIEVYNYLIDNGINEDLFINPLNLLEEGYIHSLYDRSEFILHMYWNEYLDTNQERNGSVRFYFFKFEPNIKMLFEDEFDYNIEYEED